MRTVGLKVLKKRLSEYVRLASEGETVLIADGDRVVAELVPPRDTRSLEVADALLAEAVRKGYVSPPLRRLAAPPPRAPRVMSLKRLLEQLDEEHGR